MDVDKTYMAIFDIQANLNIIKECDAKVELYLDELKAICRQLDKLLEVLSDGSDQGRLS